jgi:hypothetical protein
LSINIVFTKLTHSDKETGFFTEFTVRNASFGKKTRFLAFHGDGQDAHPTIKQTLWGTGILPVLDDCKQPQKTDSLWNRHLACT